MNDTWEYQAISPPLPESFGHVDHVALLRLAKALGAEGWEMVGYGVGGIWFKRRIETVRAWSAAVEALVAAVDEHSRCLRAEAKGGEG